MAQLTEQNVLDYRRGGDTIADFAEKYMAEMTRIYQFLNNIRTHNSAGAVQVEPEPYQLKVEDNKIYIRNEGNDEWVFLMKVAKNGGFKADTFGKLTSGAASDKPETGVSTYDTYWDTDNGKVYMYLDDAWHLLLSLNVADLTGYNNLVKRDTDVIEPSDTTTIYTTPQKIVQTNDNGVLPVDILGNAGKIAGIKNEVNNLQDGQVLTYRAVSNSWRNEPKGVVGAGASLVINDGETQLAEYSGDEHKEVDVGVTIGITTHNSNANAHANLAHYTATDAHADLFHLRKTETAYVAGDIAYSALLPSWARLEAVNNGTTGTGELPITGITLEAGQYITDGTVKWIIDDIRDGDRVGDVVFHSVLLPCHILADGATLADVNTDYPRLLATVIAENMVTSDSTDMGKYYYDEVAGTLRVPKADDGRFIEGSTTAGTAKSAGLPNIKGVARQLLAYISLPTNGAFSTENQTQSFPSSSAENVHRFDITFDASRVSDIYSNDVTTVQPKAITSIAQIKY